MSKIKTVSERKRAANKANAQHSTGPRTENGKAKAKTNATKHGLNTGFLQIDPEDRPHYETLAQRLHDETKPKGTLEKDAVQQMLDSAWRLRQIRKYIHQIFETSGEDPINDPQLGQLNRHRASAEMAFHRALNALRDLQTIRLGRQAHLAKIEEDVFGPLASPEAFAFQNIDGVPLGRQSRELHYEYEGITTLRE